MKTKIFLFKRVQYAKNHVHCKVVKVYKVYPGIFKRSSMRTFKIDNMLYVPLRPVRPMYPIAPTVPLSPWPNCSPCSPLAPFGPGSKKPRPGAPCGPTSPTSPRSPVVKGCKFKVKSVYYYEY